MANAQHKLTVEQPKKLHFIAEWLDHRGLSQADLVRGLGVNKATVSKWCAGDLPGETNIVLIAKFFAVEPTSLFHHPLDDWMCQMLSERPKEEVQRMIDTLQAAFPRKQS